MNKVKWWFVLLSVPFVIRWFVLLSVPFVINIIVSVYILMSNRMPDFIGYLSGTIVAAIIVYVCFWEIIKAVSKGTMQLLKIMAWGFLAKLVFVSIAVFGGNFFGKFDRFYFVISFFVFIMLATIIEILYFYSLSLKKQ